MQNDYNEKHFLSHGGCMPSKAPTTTPETAAQLASWGKEIRAHRKRLGVSAVVAAEAAGMSRVTLYRIENGEPSVTIGAYLNLLHAVGMTVDLYTLGQREKQDLEGQWLPTRVRLGDYPELKKLAWQVHGTDELSPTEALSIYERNWRHLDLKALSDHERHLIDALRRALKKGRPDV